MTDNRSRPYRSPDPHDRSHGGQGHSPNGDPLAELARLIGQQSDSFPGHTQEPMRGGGRDPYHAQRRDDSDPFRTPADPFRTPLDPYPPVEHRGYADPYSDRAHPHNEQHYSDPHHSDPRYGDPHYSDPRYSDPRHSDPQYSDPQYSEPPYGDPRFDNSQYSDPRHAAPDYLPDYGAHGHGPQDYSAPSHAEPYREQPLPPQPYPAQPYAAQPYADHRGAPQYDQPPLHNDRGEDYPQSYGSAPYGQDQQGYADPYYRGVPHPAEVQEEAAPRRRGGLVTVLAVLALAVVGTAAAFGYRAVFGTAGTPIPPVIRADASPTKVVPTSQSAENSNKPIQDRVGAGQERVVAREEQPMDINATRSATPRTVLANPIAPLPTSPFPQTAVAAPLAGAPSTTTTASTEPKKIRTVAIRPETSAPAESANARASAAPAPRVAAVEEPARPNAIRPQPVPPATTTTASTGNGPLSLAPTSSPSANPPAPRQNMRTASAPAAVPADGSGYSVQVTSQRSEEEAQSAYRSLQSKFQSVLGSRQVVIRRADLGDKGTYYRAQIPFGSQSEASEFCSSLKAAGGQCLVQRN